jgi:hypothetical protein
MKKILEFLNKIKEFFLCMLRGKCEYSIKKFLSYVFTLLAVYLAVFTTKSDMFLQTLIFIAGLLAIRSYDKTNYNKEENKG